MLSGDEILKEIEKENIIIKPFDKKFINPNSYNLHLDDELVVYTDDVLDCKKKNKTESFIIPEEGFVLQPNTLYLAKTKEFTFTDKYVPMLNGRSSIGRLGVSIHVTAAFGDVGFSGTWTLEIFCIKPVKIYRNMELCQICYFPVIGDNNIKYIGKYNNNGEINASKIHEEF